jgi:hypothetical protein
MGINYKGSQGQTERAVALWEEEEELQNWFGYPYSPAISKCGAYNKGTTNFTGVYRCLNLLLPLENKRV